MHATGILVLVLLFHGDITFSWMPVPENTGILKPAMETKANVTTAVPAVVCRTGKNVTGECVERERCDYGPGGVDFTIYAPRWYRKPCKVAEVCCPYQFIQEKSQLEERSVDSDDYFEFDDDEY